MIKINQMSLKNLSNIFLFIACIFICQGLLSMASAKEKNLSPKSKFQQALENAQANNAKRFKFIDRKGKERHYEINNGVINETTKDDLSSSSPFESALNNAQKRGLTSFQFTDYKGKKRTYNIDKNGTINEIKSVEDDFRPENIANIPRAFKASNEEKVNRKEKVKKVQVQQNNSEKTTENFTTAFEEDAKQASKNIDIDAKKVKKEPYKKMKLTLKDINYSLTFGTRLWISEGETEFAHCSSVECGSVVTTIGGVTGSLGDPTSKLEYTSLRDRFIELTGDLKVSDIVVQSKIGVKQKGDTGKFRDFDWITDGSSVAAAGTVFEFSDTISPVKEVYLDYQVWDIGYQFDLSKFFKGVNLSITPLIGHVRYQEKAKAFGLFDLPDDLGAGSGWTVDTDTLVLQNQILWTGTRLGTEINWQASPKANFLTNIAYVEGMDVRNEDSHVLRGDLGPTPNVISKGDGRGWMIDLIGKYAYNNNLGFELGYRYWRFEDRNASVSFGPDFTGSLPVRQLYSQRQGFMLGAEYTF
tara:strand:- start:1215 stop:2798 length:1584 start_codon:yes stop_codon:yes gene_type:complete